MIISYYNIIQYKFMTTISVPIPPAMEESLNELIRNGRGANKAEIVRRAIDVFLEKEAIDEVIRAAQEPSLSGDLRELMKKFK